MNRAGLALAFGIFVCLMAGHFASAASANLYFCPSRGECKATSGLYSSDFWGVAECSDNLLFYAVSSVSPVGGGCFISKAACDSFCKRPGGLPTSLPSPLPAREDFKSALYFNNGNYCEATSGKYWLNSTGKAECNANLDRYRPGHVRGCYTGLDRCNGNVCGEGQCDTAPVATQRASSCIPKLYADCYNGDSYWFDSCGKVGELKQSCGGVGCTSGRCGQVCSPQAHASCYNGDLHWFDSCGNPGQLKQSCNGAGCSRDQCQQATCTPQAFAACYNNDVFWFDSCGNLGAFKQSCNGAGCSNGQCNLCAPNAYKHCFSGGVYWYDSCGKAGPLIEQCVGARCSDGKCACADNAYSDCYNGNVMWFDSCGGLRSVKQSCNGLGCSNGQCNSPTPTPTPAPQQPSCTANSYASCYNGDVYMFDACGNPAFVSVYCNGAGCSNGKCKSCQPYSRADCYGSDLWWFDSCGHAQQLAQSCGGSCSNGQCRPSATAQPAQPTASCSPNEYLSCVGGTDFYWYDSCGNRGSLYKSCGAAGCTKECADGAQCTPETYMGCYNGDLYYYDSCGNLGGMMQSCNGAGCSNGQCQAKARCMFQASSACSNGDLYYYDSCGNRGDVKQSCGGKGCTGNLCNCPGNSYFGCYNNDVYLFDACGNRNSIQQSCGGNGCQNGACAVYYAGTSGATDIAFTIPLDGINLIGFGVEGVKFLTIGSCIDEGWITGGCAFDVFSTGILLVPEVNVVSAGAKAEKVIASGIDLLKEIRTADRLVTILSKIKLAGLPSKAMVTGAKVAEASKLGIITVDFSRGAISTRYWKVADAFFSGSDAAVKRLLQSGAKLDDIEHLLKSGVPMETLENVAKKGGIIKDTLLATDTAFVVETGERVATPVWLTQNRWSTHVYPKHVVGTIPDGTLFSKIGWPVDDAFIQGKIFETVKNPERAMKSVSGGGWCLLREVAGTGYKLAVILYPSGELNSAYLDDGPLSKFSCK